MRTKTNIVNPFRMMSLILSVALLFAGYTGVHAAHQHNELGEALSYGHFGQPHNAVLSGEFTFIAEVKGDVDRVEFSIYRSGDSLDVSNALARQTVTEPTNTYEEFSYYHFNWSSTGVEDGDYRLFGYIECDECTENGWRDTIRHSAGEGGLDFTVDNPEIASDEPDTVVAPEDETFICSLDIEEIDRISNSILQKHQSNLLFVDEFLQQANLFYDRSEIAIIGYDSIQEDLSGLRKQASDSIVLLENYDLVCSKETAAAVEDFLQNSAETRGSLEAYKDGVINYLLEILKEA